MKWCAKRFIDDATAFRFSVRVQIRRENVNNFYYSLISVKKMLNSLLKANYESGALFIYFNEWKMKTFEAQ